MMPRKSARRYRLYRSTLAVALCLTLLGAAAGAAAADDSAAISNRAKAQALTAAAIKMTDSAQALKLLWQATDIDPTLTEPYTYLGLYYNSRSDWPDVVKVYQKLLQYQPGLVSAYLNVGEAYMQFNPPANDKALAYYRKAYQLDPHSAYAALRIGELLAEEGNSGAIKYLKQAAASRGTSSDPSIAAEAEQVLSKLGVP